jgi:hypothetical protein
MVNLELTGQEADILTSLLSHALTVSGRRLVAVVASEQQITPKEVRGRVAGLVITLKERPGEVKMVRFRRDEEFRQIEKEETER